MILTLPPSAGPQVVKRVLRTRWRAFVIAFSAVIIGAAAWMGIVDRSYTASNVVQLAAIGLDPTTTTRRGGESVDITTEIELVRSALTASKAIETLGPEWSAADLIDDVEVSADPLGAVITISWTDTDPQRALDASSALAQAYLEVRGELATTRADSLRESIDSELARLNDELAATTGDSLSDSIVRDSLRSQVNALNTRRVALEGYSAPSGLIITSETAVPLQVGPSWIKMGAIAVLGGIFLGIAAVIIRERTDSTVRDSGQLAEIIAAPVWGPDLSGRGQVRWYSGARMALLAGKDRGVPALLIDSTELEAPLLIGAVEDAYSDQGYGSGLLIIDLHEPRERVLRSFSFAGHIAIAPGPHMPRQEVRQLVDQIDSSGCELIGAFILPPDTRSTGKDMVGVASSLAESDTGSEKTAARVH